MDIASVLLSKNDNDTLLLIPDAFYAGSVLIFSSPSSGLKYVIAIVLLVCCLVCPVTCNHVPCRPTVGLAAVRRFVGVDLDRT